MLSLLPIQGGPVLQDGDRGEPRRRVSEGEEGPQDWIPFPKTAFCLLFHLAPSRESWPSFVGVLLTDETVKAQVGHQANNKHSCIT